MSLVQISNKSWVRWDTISSCEIIKSEDNACYYVKFATDDGEKMSDAFTSRVKANEWVTELANLILPMFGEIEEDDS